jgi:hypothetical protein
MDGFAFARTKARHAARGPQRRKGDLSFPLEVRQYK